MKQRKILNFCMVLAILFAIGCGLMAVGTIKGWFADEQGAAWEASEKSGITTVERKGVAYELTIGALLKPEDTLQTKTAASLVLSKDNQPMVYMDSDTKLSISSIDAPSDLKVEKGIVTTDTRKGNGLMFLAGKSKITAEACLVSISRQAGATTIYVYSGEVALENIENPGKDLTTVSAGEKALILDENSPAEISKLRVKNLSETQIETLKLCGLDKNCCFTEADLKQTQKQRKAETKERQEDAVQEKADKETEPSSKGDTASQTDVTKPGKSEKEEETTKPDSKTTCTIQIVCDTILDNRGNLNPEKDGYVPSSGVILGTTTMEFTDGETVFDVLQRTCAQNNIQIEYAYTPIYESYYIEGINHIYEFDCGPESGWMYKVNGWFPNYGCSSYTLQDGDTIVWCYSCNGLGADVGGSNF